MKLKKLKASGKVEKKSHTVIKNCRVNLTRLTPDIIQQFTGVDLNKPNNIINLRLKINRSGQVSCIRDLGPNIPVTVTIAETHDGNSEDDFNFRIKLSENQPFDHQQKIDSSNQNGSRMYSLRSGAVVENVLSVNERGNCRVRAVRDVQTKIMDKCEGKPTNKGSISSGTSIENILSDDDRGRYALRRKVAHEEQPKKTVSLAVSKIGVSVQKNQLWSKCKKLTNKTKLIEGAVVFGKQVRSNCHNLMNADFRFG